MRPAAEGSWNGGTHWTRFTERDPERAARLEDLTVELRSLLAMGTEMAAVQEALRARGVGVMDAVIVTRELLGAVPGALARAKTLVLTSPAWTVERKKHQQFVEDLADALEQTNHGPAEMRMPHTWGNPG